MTRPIRWLAMLLTLSAAPVAAGPAVEALTPAAYRAELDRVLEATRGATGRPADLRPLVATIPLSWHIDTGSGVFDVPTAWLRRHLQALSRKPDPGEAALVQDRLLRLRDELDAYEAAPRDTATERARLARILARPEFSRVHGPSWFDLLRQRVLVWLVAWLERIIGSSNIPAVGRVVVYALVGVALLVTAFWLYRSLKARRVAGVVPSQRTAPAAKDWAAWLAEAHEAAGQGAWRDGVHLAYWAAIAWLEARGAWPPDRARTPREYLRLVPADHEDRAALCSLTSTFELVWYGQQPADHRTFSTAIAHLERLGCRA
jgi:hypothetical protein